MIVKQTTLIVTENTRLADGIYRLRLAGDTSAITALQNGEIDYMIVPILSLIHI